MRNDIKYWVWLALVFGPASRRLWQFMNLCETAEEVYHEIFSGIIAEKLTDKERASINSFTLANAEAIIAVCRKKGIDIIDYSSADYPRPLRFIADPPAVLYYKGNIGCLNGTAVVTAVGTRRAGAYSLSAAEKICAQLAKAGIVIVSGFAVGIDITSQLAGVSVGKPTACVLGCGIDVDYPRENVQYRDKILSAGGVIISEYPPGTSPHPSNFPKRNRLLSALGRAAIVFEAAIKSGSLITARLSVEQGREVFVLPPADIFSSLYAGNVALLREGAVPLLSAEDIIDYFKIGSGYAEIKTDIYAMMNGGKCAEHGSLTKMHIESEELTESTEVFEEAEENEEHIAESEKAPLPEVTEGIQRDIVNLLSEEGILHADVICMRLDIDSADLMTELTELEIIGAVKSRPGRMYELV